MMTPLLFSLIFACAQKEPIATDPDTGSTDEPSQPSVQPEPSQPESSETDEDGDGFSIEGGDCDDTDPWTNPLRDEEGGDGVDNDCDGMIDELWDGLTAALQSPNGDHSLVHLNPIGNIVSETPLDQLVTDS